MWEISYRDTITLTVYTDFLGLYRWEKDAEPIQTTLEAIGIGYRWERTRRIEDSIGFKLFIARSSAYDKWEIVDLILCYAKKATIEGRYKQ